MTRDDAVRTRLGIPADANEVLVVTESTHWDPDWLLTSSEYLRAMVIPTLDRALDALGEEPRRVYSVECAFYPEAYLRARPERRDEFVAFANDGRLRFTGSGVTTPDTLLPSDEALLRDLLEGSLWRRRVGIVTEPRSQYLPDSFGHSPGLPALLGAAGVDYAGICRIDGMRFPGAELETERHFPWPGTSAERLYDEGSADFIWRSPDGSEVLTHWYSHGYGHGDMIGHGGFTRTMGLPLAWPSRDAAKVAARIERYLDQLRPLCRTPYRLLAIGFDFSRPVPDLIELIDAWNDRDYDRTGVWLVNAGLDDYLDLVTTKRDLLPTIELDPNPYWTGFYATRPALKNACASLHFDLVALDSRRVWHRLGGGTVDATSNTSVDDDVRADAARWIAATSNHHDLITGTSPDRTARREQWPWLHRAHAEVRRACTKLGSADVSNTTERSEPATPRCRVQRSGHLVTVCTTHFTATFDESRGGTLTRLVGDDTKELVNPGTLSCVAISERGGLWRMGYEFPGGRWLAVDATIDHPATVTAHTTPVGTVVTIDAVLERRPVTIRVTFDDASPFIGVTTVVEPRLRRSVTLAWRGREPIDALVMHQPGAVVTRPLTKRYEPTFWPLHSWALASPTTHANASSSSPGPLAVAAATPTALHAYPSGTVETVIARTALRELAWGVVPLLGPAMGYDRGPQQANLSFGWADNDTSAHRIGRLIHHGAQALAGRTAPDWAVVCDDPDVEIMTVKPADVGSGIIVRIRNWDVATKPRSAKIRFDPRTGHQVHRAWRCTSNEEDLGMVPVTDGSVDVELDAHMLTFRLQS